MRTPKMKIKNLVLILMKAFAVPVSLVATASGCAMVAGVLYGLGYLVKLAVELILYVPETIPLGTIFVWGVYALFVILGLIIIGFALHEKDALGNAVPQKRIVAKQLPKVGKQ